jgi:hypothetical protein
MKFSYDVKLPPKKSFKGGAITGDRLDLFVGHDDPMQWGVRYKKVYIKETAE